MAFRFRRPSIAALAAVLLAASTAAPHLGRRKQPPPSLVELRANRVPSQPNGTLIDHAIDLALSVKNRNPQDLSQSDAPPADDDSVIVRNVLTSFT